ncbi:ste ste11 protein kinase [Moniliophthora roreri]|nr:ste ste11 protein kinase [Moniliophthora roreri]
MTLGFDVLDVRLLRHNTAMLPIRMDSRGARPRFSSSASETEARVLTRQPAPRSLFRSLSTVLPQNLERTN